MLFYGCIATIAAAVLSAPITAFLKDRAGAQLSAALVVGLAVLVAALFGALLGFIQFAIFAVVFNLIAALSGGIEVGLNLGSETKPEPESPLLKPSLSLEVPANQRSVDGVYRGEKQKKR